MPPIVDRREPRVETAVTPIIRAESVHIPTPAWGALSAADTELLEAELVDTDALPQVDDWDDESPVARPAWPGWIAFLLAIAAAVVQGVAIVAEAGKDYELATILAWIAIGVSIAAVLGGIVAAILRCGRGPGIAAAVVGALANPWLLLQVLTVLRG